MKAIPLGLISSIIFSIVLAEKRADSESTTGCFPFCRKKAKKSHKTADEPVEDTGYDPDLPNIDFIDEYLSTVMEICKIPKPIVGELFTSEDDDTTVDEVTGFSRRKYDPLRIGRYFRPYEEAFEYRNSYIVIPFRDIHHYNEMVECGRALFHPTPPRIPEKQELPAVPKIPELPKIPALPKIPEKQEFPKKQELPVEQKLSAIYGEASNTLYKDTKELDEVPSYLGDGKNEGENNENEEIYEKNKHLLCTNLEETMNAIELMDEAVKHLEYHSTDTNDYESDEINPSTSTDFCEGKHENHTDVIKINFKMYSLDKYNKLINELWNPDANNFLYKVARVYNPNLVMIQQRYKKNSKEPQKYFYALVKKAQISEDKTIIVMTSGNINDHNPSDIEYKNRIIESANLFTTEVDSEDDIRSGKLKKVFVNLAGYIIEKKHDHIYVTYVESIDEHDSS
ncbi:fam-a protein [Plasmodium chabaudi adami]|uniref:Fam-a protein n=1 Tax=Plasmodium chabaudi adami TaxID=5826 RepID=A0A1C6WG58_PLACE|nr:fam-a protein [Plasmodium chabaudi adami]